MTNETKIFFLQLITVLVMIYIVFAGEEDCLGLDKNVRPIRCYECLSFSSIDNHCGDPFNETLKGITTNLCNGYCVKWVRDVQPGVIRYQRTCSTNLTITMNINLVCIAESRPRSGEICFCDKAKCNTGSKPLHCPKNFLMTFFAILFITCFR